MAGIANTKGIDISDWQGNIDLEKVKKAGYRFVMIKMGIGSDSKDQDDRQFENNVKKAEKLGLPWGAYFYTYSLSPEQDKSELNHILRLLKGKKPTLPIAIDVEDADGYKKNHGGWTFNNVNRNAKYLLEGLKKAGYYPVLYTGYEEMQNYISKDVWSKYDLWVAHWAKKCWYTGKNLGIWQYGGEENYIDTPYIPGIDGKIDKDIVYKDYPTIIKNGGYNGWNKQTTSNKTTTTTSKTTTTASKTSTSTITGQQLREKCCNIINGWLGAKEGDSVHAEILRIYNSQKNLDYHMGVNDAWCAATVSAVWIKAGISAYVPISVNCGVLKDLAIKKGQWVENDAYVPKIGDAIIYYWSDSGSGDCNWGADHVGMVTKVSGNKIIVTEGNMGSGVVGKREITVNQRYIRGYIAPNYDAIAKKVSGKVTPDPTPTPKPSGGGKATIKDVQTWLNKTYKTGLTVDGVYGTKTKAALVKALQTELNKQFGAGLTVDGIYGPKTASYVMTLSTGTQGNITKILQGFLICNGYSTNGFDGVFGSGTASAVKSYQSKRGVTADGIAGPVTWGLLAK